MKMLLWLVAVAFLAGDGTSMPGAAVADETSKVSITAPTAVPREAPTVAQTSNPREEWRVYGSIRPTRSIRR